VWNKLPHTHTPHTHNFSSTQFGPPSKRIIWNDHFLISCPLLLLVQFCRFNRNRGFTPSVSVCFRLFRLPFCNYNSRLRIFGVTIYGNFANGQKKRRKKLNKQVKPSLPSPAIKNLSAINIHLHDHQVVQLHPLTPPTSWLINSTTHRRKKTSCRSLWRHSLGRQSHWKWRVMTLLTMWKQRCYPPTRPPLPCGLIPHLRFKTRKVSHQISSGSSLQESNLKVSSHFVWNCFSSHIHHRWSHTGWLQHSKGINFASCASPPGWNADFCEDAHWQDHHAGGGEQWHHWQCQGKDSGQRRNPSRSTAAHFCWEAAWRSVFGQLGKLSMMEGEGVG